jgi:hypothetical protein
MTPLRQTTGKTTGSPQFDARILRDYDLPAGPKLPAKARDLVRLQMWKIFHAPGKLTPLQKRLLSQYCVIMELSLRH